MSFQITGHSNSKTPKEVREAVRKIVAELDASHLTISDAEGAHDLLKPEDQ